MTSDPVMGRQLGYWSENELVWTSDGHGFGHDAFGRIIDTIHNGSVNQRFFHDGVHMTAAVDPSAAIIERYVRGDGPDEMIAWYEGSGSANRRWAHQNERGSVVAVSDGGGTPIAINRYDEYGKPQAGNTGRFQYTGQLWLPQINLYHYKARNFAPHLGRFMQTDPIGYEGGVNLYAYVGNDPVNWTDPLGLDRTVAVVTCRTVAISDPDDGGGVSGEGCYTTYYVLRSFNDSAAGLPSRAGGGERLCPTGSRLTLNIGPSGTLFVGVLGISVNATVNVSIPWSSLRRGELTGMQLGGSASGTLLGGVGGFAGFGGWSVGSSNGPQPIGRYSSVQPVLQLGAGTGGGVEVAADGIGQREQNVGVSAGGRGAIGAYGAFGVKATGAVNTRPLGCRR